MVAKKNKYWMPVVVGVIFFCIFSFVLIKFVFQARKANDEQIAEHINQLDNIFTKINNTCKIIGFSHKKEDIDFLTVKDFVGSVVGPLHLAMPEKWQGPYLDRNLTIDGIEYQVVLAKSGYYVIPGDNVTLSNGKIINKTIKFSPETDIDIMMRDSNYLLSNGKPLAAYIEIAENPDRSKTDDLIIGHLKKLKEVFEKIHADCKITGFRHGKDKINFLNVKSFAGSIVGSMNLLYPKKWAGPYMDFNPSVGNKLYQIMFIRDGYYILPGDGVRLGNGQIINRTMHIDSKTDIGALMRDPRALLSYDHPLAVKIETTKY